MDLQLANAVVLVVSENFSQYGDATQRDLLEGIFELADDCKEGLSERPDAQDYEHLQTCLSLAKLFVSDALKDGNFVEGFRRAAECFWPTAVVPRLA
jgi:hypothetical protein